MATLIKERRVVADSWLLLERGPDGALPALPERDKLIVPLALWLERRAEPAALPAKLGVWLDSHEEPGALEGDLDRFELIAVNFPKFVDGRGFSTGRLLRERYGYQGELRAIGEVARDHLFYLASCGFDAFALRDSEDAGEALGAFADFSENYQATVTRPVPLFRRRLESTGT